MSFLCNLGFHRFKKREIHFNQGAPWVPEVPVPASVLLRCACGEAKLDPSGEMPTILVFSTSPVKVKS